MQISAWIERLEELESIDRWSRGFERRIPAALRSGPLRDRLAGRWLGHALHPTLTDIPISLWTSATLLDLVAPRRWRAASTMLATGGVFAALPTTAAGVVEWLDTPLEQRRVGVVHAAFNSAATLLYLASVVSKLSGARRRGVTTSLCGALMLAGGGLLGGHLAFARGVGVDRTVQQRGQHRLPVEVDRTTQEARAEAVEGDRFLLVDVDGEVIAVPDRCTRCGGALRRKAADRLDCPRDGSRFAVAVGEVERGPATTPLPRFALIDDGEHQRLHRRGSSG